MAKSGLRKLQQAGVTYLKTRLKSLVVQKEAVFIFSDKKIVVYLQAENL